MKASELIRQLAENITREGDRDVSVDLGFRAVNGVQYDPITTVDVIYHEDATHFVIT